MEVLVGPTFAIEVPSSPPHAPPVAYDGDRTASGCDDGEREVPKSFFEDGSGFRVGGRSGFFAGDSSGSSSSIGTPDDSDVEYDVVSSKKENEGGEEEEEVQSKLKCLDSFDSLEDSLPIKRGLSNHFTGKSKSFSDLSKVSSVKDLQKQENPLNKRRRVLIASKCSKRSSFYTWSNPKSMPLLPLDEESDAEEEGKVEEEGEEEGKGRKVSFSPSSSPSSAEEKKPQDHEVLLRQQNSVPLSYAAHMRRRLGSFKSRSLSLADLQEHDEDEDDNDDDDDD